MRLKPYLAWAPIVPLVLALAVSAVAPAAAQTVAAYHGGSERTGSYVTPALTWDSASRLRQETGFSPSFSGNLYAQPLYWRPADRQSGMLIVGSESDTVTALDAATGGTLWTRRLGTPAPLAALRCGNIDPLGITGTPVIDQQSGTLYLDAVILDGGQPRHKLFALALADGASLPGWPLDVAQLLRGLGQSFDTHVQNERGALLLLDGTLYVPYGGFFGDCGDYHGWVLGVNTHNPSQVSAWRTRARAGGIWAPGGIASDGRSLFVTTGNTEGASDWSDGEAVIRLAPDLHRSDSSADYFAPTDWRQLDTRDADLGGTNPLPFDLPTPGGTQPLLLALGKDERAYLLDRRDLGGIGGSIVAQRVAQYPIRTSPAAYLADGAEFVAFQARGAACPAGQRGDLTVLRIAGGPPATLQTAWCGGMSGGGAPIVTTSDGSANPIVWVVGAEGDNRLHGFRGDTGQPLFTSAPLAGLHHFQTLIAADDRLFVGADGRVYAFSLPR